MIADFTFRAQQRQALCAEAPRDHTRSLDVFTEGEVVARDEAIMAVVIRCSRVDAMTVA